jgi:peptide/nickel transport system ATP-binding protein
VQLVLQHSERAINPRWKIREVLAEGGADLDAVLRTRLVRSEWFDAFPHEISGGQMQRVNLARALLAKPRHVIADEITASLDAITQAQIWEILLDGVRRDGYGVLAISHDRALLDRVADRIVEMDVINA